jgi:hypothetical protein
MTDTTCVIDPVDALDVRDPLAGERPDGAAADQLAEAEGWQALALATRGEPLTDPELAAAELLPIDIALDLLFPGLDDPARHEAMSALDRPAG